MKNNNDASGGKKCVFVGRFQPFHNGHLEAVRWILSRYDELSIVIGSAQEYATALNPLTCFERRAMIEKVLEAEGIKNVDIFFLPDFRNDVAWSKKLAAILGANPDDLAVLTMNPWTERAAKKTGIGTVAHPMFFNDLSATAVRAKIAAGGEWKALVPKKVFDYLISGGFDKRIAAAQVSAETKIIGFIKEAVAKSGMRGAIVAVSGGVDSALVAALARKALGKKVQYVFLPFFKTCPFRKNVALLERSLKIGVKRIYLDKVLAGFVKVLPPGGNLAYGNLKPRIRMAVLYYLANQKKLLVFGTTNRSELEIGYFTKYGDGGVDAEPIADLYKTEVFELAREMKVPIDILETAPTAALWPGQTDEKELGVSYFELDTVLKMMRAGFAKDDIIKLTNIKQVRIDKILARISRNAHKSAMPPICRLK